MVEVPDRVHLRLEIGKKFHISRLILLGSFLQKLRYMTNLHSHRRRDILLRVAGQPRPAVFGVRLRSARIAAALGCRAASG